MRRFILGIFCCAFLAGVLPSLAATGRVIKVLPQFLDLQGRQTLSPSLFERDAYQAYLRDHTNEVSGMRFAVQWKAGGVKWAPLVLRIEMRGTVHGRQPSRSTWEYEIKPGGWLSRWTYLPIVGEEYKKFGHVSAWRVTIWEGDKLLSEQKSFLW
ncbi:MAG: hypothetical protein U1F65_11695 [Verrucomicrobiota bacterium]